MPWLRLPSNGTSSSGLPGQQMSRWLFTFFCKHIKSTRASSFSFYLLFTPTHSLLTSASAQRKISILVTFFFQLQSQPPARAQVWAVVGGGKEAGAGRFVLLSPQRFSELLHFNFYVSSKVFKAFTFYFLLDVSSWRLLEVVALFASDGSNLIGKAQVERIQDEFCLLLYRCFQKTEKFANLFQILRFLVDRDGQVKAARR